MNEPIWDAVEAFNGDNPNVVKYVFTKSDAVAESVLYKYPTYEERTVICCSTMSGCPVGCRFCGTGNFYVRKLTAEEIVEQVEFCLERTGVRYVNEIGKLQIMVMSMGEPLLNLDALESAFETLYARYPKAALLISTIGPKCDWPRVLNMSVRIPTIGLQFSVHESEDARRNALIPYPSKLSLRGIAETGLAWWQETGRKPFFNYCATSKNISSDDAGRLRNLFPPYVWNATVSVVCESEEGVPATSEWQRSYASSFASELLALGYDTRVFDPAGQDDIGGGCGQLWFVQRWADNNPQLTKRSIGFGKPRISLRGEL